MPRSWYTIMIHDHDTTIMIPRSWYHDHDTTIMITRSWYHDHDNTIMMSPSWCHDHNAMSRSWCHDHDVTIMIPRLFHHHDMAWTSSYTVFDTCLAGIFEISLWLTCLQTGHSEIRYSECTAVLLNDVTLLCACLSVPMTLMMSHSLPCLSQIPPSAEWRDAR